MQLGTPGASRDVRFLVVPEPKEGKGRGGERRGDGKTFAENSDDLHISGEARMSATRATQHRRGGKVSTAAGEALLAGGSVTNTH
ncbi:hypothetical protein E2C01_017693 [Portunus trituberculatus]|uniref:Uncharacterized protein n=1 Tax=Portunus trituberculatus TaxID=210409 RepID=A0A5B7DTK2_PORTR|nr:hypothetical protein [Portunus trituberculatus]